MIYTFLEWVKIGSLAVWNFLKKAFQDSPWRIVIYGTLIVLIWTSLYITANIHEQIRTILDNERHQNQEQQAFLDNLKKIQPVITKINVAKSKQIDTSNFEVEIASLRYRIIVIRDFSRTDQTVSILNDQLDRLIAARDKEIIIETERLQTAEKERLQIEEGEKQKGDLTGIITGPDGPLSAATVKLKTGTTVLVNGTTGGDGKYTIHYKNGQYTLAVSRSGYVSVTKYNITITAGQVNNLNLNLDKSLPPLPDHQPGSNYWQQTVNSFLNDIMSFDLNYYQVLTDVAGESNDCTNGCSAKSVKDHVNDLGGYAGFNGTYFCPPDYSWCSSKINSFWEKVYNSRRNTGVNWNNGLGDFNPFFAFNQNGSFHFYSTWKDYQNSGNSISAGVAAGPILIKAGQNVLNPNSLDDKQRNTRTSRGAIGIKGNTVYAINTKGATVVDLAAVCNALGMDYAINLDGGGSSAFYFNGSYKIGPGRLVPNAIVFKRK